MTEPMFPLLSLVRLRMGTDGEGVTTLIAGAGCPLDCRWCINKKLLREAPAKPVTAADLLEKVRIDDLYFQATGGGVTFGGGESLLHAGFIRRFRELAPREWRIRAETSLVVSRELLLTAMDAVDDFIVDCKDMNREIYHRYTGGDGSLMTENLNLLLQSVGPERVLVRVPLIPEYNKEEDRKRSEQTLRSMGVQKLDIFNYVIR